jgi:AcrR family transcriptional regulator
MAIRQYRLGRRQASVDRTRRQILSAARDVFTEAGFHSAGLEEVAARAGVTRKTVYNQFGSKRGLLDALISDLEERPAIGHRVEAILAAPDPRTSLDGYFHEACRFWAANQTVMRNLYGLAATDAEARQVLAAHDAARKRRLVPFVTRLAARQQLSTGAAEAIETMWLLGSFAAFDHLSATSSLPITRVARILGRLARSLLR